MFKIALMTVAILLTIFAAFVLYFIWRLKKSFKALSTNPDKLKESLNRLNKKQVDGLMNPSGSGCCGK